MPPLLDAMQQEILALQKEVEAAFVFLLALYIIVLCVLFARARGENK